ncbi:hypothetical protein N7454_010553 [Penicillium verhagenii]|nr:hypothetical protein N7454_010553 [Penicillium verhagenii]
MDEYHEQFNELMVMGKNKGDHVADIISQRKPEVMIELGGYVGYSAICFGEAMRKNNGKQYLSIEKNPEMAAVADQLVELAGLRGIVRIIVGSTNEVLRELVQKGEIEIVEMVLIDFWRDQSLRDLWLLEELDVLLPINSLIVADNLFMPGAPDYLKWMRATEEEKRKIMAESDLCGLTPDPSMDYSTTIAEYEPAFKVL